MAMVSVRSGAARAGMIASGDDADVIAHAAALSLRLPSSVITGILACAMRLDVMGGDEHRGAEPVELEEEPQQALGEGGIDIAGRLVGEEELRLGDDGARDRGALLLAARQYGRHDARLLGKPHPFEELHDIGAVASPRASPATRSGSATFS